MKHDNQTADIQTWLDDNRARPLPTRDDIADAIEHSGIAIGTTDAEHAADAVLDLLKGQDR